MSTGSSRRTPPLGVQAYEEICRRIITLEYEPGRILDEKQLMVDFGLGRTPVREALLRLAGEGWVESQPNRGATVPAITLQSTKALFEAMRVLEIGLAELAIVRNHSVSIEAMARANAEVRRAVANGDLFGLVEANHAFHVEFAHCSRNEHLVRAVREIRNQAKRLTYLSFSHEIAAETALQAHYASVVAEHDGIVALLREKEERGLKEVLVRHINTFQRRVIAYMTS